MALTASTMLDLGTPAAEFHLPGDVSLAALSVRETHPAGAGQLSPGLRRDRAKLIAPPARPDFFVFDEGRKLLYRGQFDASRPGNDVPVTGRRLRAAVDAVLAGLAVDPVHRPSLGCNIKWKPGNEPVFA
jgi:hypothetical protein